MRIQYELLRTTSKRIFESYIWYSSQIKNSWKISPYNRVLVVVEIELARYVFAYFLTRYTGHSLNFSFLSFIYQMQKCIPRAGPLGKQVMSRTCAVRYSALSVWKAFTSTRNQIYASDTSRNPLQSYLVFHSILDLLLKMSFLSKLLLILLHYFIIFG